LIHAALINQVLEQTSHRVVGERRDDSGVEPEATFEPARYVVFAAAFVNASVGRGQNLDVIDGRSLAAVRDAFDTDLVAGPQSDA
jgi:hypothetical protein